MRCQTLISCLFFTLLLISKVQAQDTTDIMSQLEREMGRSEKNQTFYTSSTFKTTRLINGHSVENTGKRVLDVKISHRFDEVNQGSYGFFGLDEATMRIGFDYGFTDNLMAGIGRSNYLKTYDAFIKLKLLRQSKGKKNMPVTLSYVPTIALRTKKFGDSIHGTDFGSRASYTHQLIIGRKFSDRTSLQLMPTYVHQRQAANTLVPKDVFAIGFGGRQKITKRISINAEYYYQLTDHRLAGTSNVFALGIDIETGGHVFQLHFTNTQAMNESDFITGTSGKWDKGDIRFGFNISRVFTIGRRHETNK
jgi:hypothetical protein